MTAKSDQRIREKYGDVVVASPSERIEQLQDIVRAAIPSAYPKAAQDAPPAPREQANLRCGHCLHAWNGSSRERSCPGCGREFAFFGPEIGTFPKSQPSPAHEALIARIEAALKVESDDAAESRMLARTAEAFDGDPSSYRWTAEAQETRRDLFRDILTALKGAQ
jgi:hypothetical protein